VTLSVRGRLALWLVASVATLLAVAGVTLLTVHNRVALHGLDEELRRINETVGAVLQNELNEGLAPPAAAEEALDEVRVAQRHVAIFSAAGEPLASRWTLPAPSAAVMPTLGAHTVETPVRARIISTAPVVPRGYVVAAGATWDELDEQRQDLLASILLLWPPALLVIVGGLLWVSRGLLNQLERAHDARRRFLIDASHELRTPVSVARTAADLALSRPTRAPAEYREALSIVAGQMRHMTRLVGDMLALARSEAFEWPVVSEEFYLDELVDQVARDMRVLGEARGIVVQVSCPQDLQHYGDQTLLRQMLTNLAENAVRHSSPLGVVDIAVRAEEAALVIHVTNRGEGIRAEDRERIFEPFVRAGGGDDDGLGLGLAIVRRIARLHDGDAHLVASSGEATTFAVRLPTQRSS
jgi:signal transduction histidine kinase